MHIFIPNIGGVLAQPREYLIWIGIGTIILLSVLKTIKEGRLIESPFKIYILLFAVLLLSSSIFNPIKNMDMFIFRSFMLITGILLWLTFLQFDLSARERLSILFLVFVSAVIESTIGVMQFFGLYRYIPITPAPEIGMVGGAFQQKNLFASWIATGIVISLYLITTNRFKDYKKVKKMLFWVSLALLSLSLIISDSRTGLFGTVLAMVMLFTLRARHYLRGKKYLGVWFMVFLIGIVGGVYLLTIRDKVGVVRVTEKRIEWLSDIKQPGYTTRLFYWRVSLEMFRDKPIFGQGFGNFSSIFRYYQGRSVRDNPEYKEFVGDNFTTHPHNEVFLILSEGGIAGLLGLLILIFGFIKVMRGYGRERAGLWIALLTPLLFHSLAEFPLQLSTAHYLLFLILLSLGTSHFSRKIELRLSTPVMRRLVIFLFLALYVVFTGYTIITLNSYNRLVKWHRDYTQTGRWNEEDIFPSTKNLYLKNWARPLYMLAKAEDAVKDVDKNRDFLEDFLKWSSLEKQRQPIMPVFYHDANVLLAMGIHYREHVYFDEAMRTVEEGLFLYPDNKELKGLRSKIVSEAFKAIFQGLERRKNP